MFLFCLADILQQYICVNGKDFISSNNHMMHPLTISGNRHVRAQHRFSMADSSKRNLGVWHLPQKL